MLSLINSEDRCRPPFYMEWELATDLSLQGLLDCDIKSETENVIGGNPDLDLSMIQMASIQPMENLTNEHVSNWIGVQSMLNGNSNHSNIDYYMDFMGCDAASVMVNPNAVVPDVTGRSPTRSNSLVSSTTSSPPASTERHFPFGSASHQQQQAAQQKSVLVSEELPELPPEFNDLGDLGVLNGLGDLNGIDLGNFDNVGEIEGSIDFVVEPEPSQPEPEASKVHNEEILSDCSSDSSLSSSVPSPSSIGSIKLRFPANKPKATVLVPASTLKSMSPQLLKIQQQQQQTLKVNGIAGLKVQNFKIIQSPNNQVQQLCRQIYNNNVQLANQQQAAEQQAAVQQVVVQQAVVQQQQLKQLKQKKQRPRPQIKKVNRAATPPNNEKDKDRPAFIEMVDKNGQVIIMKNYPKPGYSYSCLIAMALKNSVTGSLPVSEIYTFMCNHFPYFKTAPSGWKNSVRHNLSLNKCFQKMEKPPGTGTQRKGCLWGIHPAKAEKMDEELNKWTRKDPESIRNAMVDPENLEVLERGVVFFKDVEMEEESGSSTVGSENEVGSRETEFTAANSLLSDSYDESSQENSEGEGRVMKRPYQVEINYQVQTSKRRKRSESDNETQVNSLQCTARRKVTMYLTTE